MLILMKPLLVIITLPMFNSDLEDFDSPYPEIGNIHDIDAYLVAEITKGNSILRPQIQQISPYHPHEGQMVLEEQENENRKSEERALNKEMSERCIGRWKVDQHYYYILAIHECDTLDHLITHLSQTLPQRKPCQIKAHHQKMMKKHGSLENIRESYPEPRKNTQLLSICLKIGHALGKLQKLNHKIEESTKNTWTWPY